MRVIKQVLGKTVQVGGQEHAGWLPVNASQPLSTARELRSLDVRILEDIEGFILEFKFKNASGGNDSWHSTINEAEDEAKVRFGIEPSEWKSPSNPDN